MVHKLIFNKKSQETGRNIILLVIIYLLVAGVIAYLIWKVILPLIIDYADKIFS